MSLPSDHLQSGDPGDSLEPLLVTAKQVARLLGISRATVFRRDSMGGLPRSIHLGKAVRWDLAVLKAWIAAGAPPRERWEAMTTSSRSPSVRGRAA
jgi:predicted DNA-binding transcriptional regulator AlpA